MWDLCWCCTVRSLGLLWLVCKAGARNIDQGKNFVHQEPICQWNELVSTRDYCCTQYRWNQHHPPKWKQCWASMAGGIGIRGKWKKRIYNLSKALKTGSTKIDTQSTPCFPGLWGNMLSYFNEVWMKTCQRQTKWRREDHSPSNSNDRRLWQKDSHNTKPKQIPLEQKDNLKFLPHVDHVNSKLSEQCQHEGKHKRISQFRQEDIFFPKLLSHFIWLHFVHSHIRMLLDGLDDG